MLVNLPQNSSNASVPLRNISRDIALSRLAGQGTLRPDWERVLANERSSVQNVPCQAELAHGGHRLAIGAEPDVGEGRVLMTWNRAHSRLQGLGRRHRRQNARCQDGTCSRDQGCLRGTTLGSLAGCFTRRAVYSARVSSLIRCASGLRICAATCAWRGFASNRSRCRNLSPCDLLLTSIS